MEIVGRRLQSLNPKEKSRLGNLCVSRASHMALVLKESPANSCCWLALADNFIWGWSLIRWFTPDVRSSLFAYVSVFVSVSRRRSGLGRALLDETLTFIAQNRMIPCVFASHPEQRAFYKSCRIASENITHLPFPRTFWENYRFVKERLPRLKKLA